jgi:dynein heavy chain
VELVFVFACVWCVGGAFGMKDGIDFRKTFSNWWKEKFKQVRFPTKGSVFDYFVDIENSKFEEWTKMNVKSIENEIDTSKSISNYTIPTVDTIAT